jgi:hypothetical protein
MLLKTVTIAAAVAFAASLSAQSLLPPDTFKVNYYSNANEPAPDGTVRITNVGTEIGATNNPAGYITAGVFVLTPDQQLAECCFYSLSPDALLTLSIDSDLTSNPLTPVTPHTGDIKIVGFTPTSGFASHTEVPGIRAWATHIQASSITETEFSSSTLSKGELNELLSKCKAIFNNGSGFGICSGGDGEVVTAAFK